MISERTKEYILLWNLGEYILLKGFMMKIGLKISKRKMIIRNQISSRRSLIWCFSTEYKGFLRFNTKGVDVVNAMYVDACVTSYKI